jgi:hypothetical protein
VCACIYSGECIYVCVTVYDYTVFRKKNISVESRLIFELFLDPDLGFPGTMVKIVNGRGM